MSQSGLQSFLGAMAGSPVVAELCRRLADERHAAATGQWGSCAVVLAAIVQQKLDRPLLVVTGHLDEADDAVDQLLFFHPGCDVRLFPAYEVLPGESNVSHELAAQRLELLVDLKGIGERGKGEGEVSPGVPQFIVAQVQAMMQH